MVLKLAFVIHDPKLERVRRQLSFFFCDKTPRVIYTFRLIHPWVIPLVGSLRKRRYLTQSVLFHVMPPQSNTIHYDHYVLLIHEPMNSIEEMYNH